MKKKIISFLLLFVIIIQMMETMGTPEVRAEDFSDTIISYISKGLSEREENNLLEGAMPCRGEAHLLVVNLSILDAPNKLSTEEIENMYFGESYSYGSSVKDENITDYFNSVSYGKLNVTGDVVGYQLDSMPNSLSTIKEVLNDILKEKTASKYDKNEDGYFDGIIILYPDNYGQGAHVSFWEYEYDGCKSAVVTEVESNVYRSVSTIEHEIVHLMGLPDIYANVSLNPAGTCAETLMDGANGRWNSELGYKSANIPGIMKFFFGWIDDMQEVHTDGLYSLNSYSSTSSAMVIYPKGDTQSRFVFFVEYITLENNDTVLEGKSYIGDGGLRIWKVYLDNPENIIYQSGAGCGNSPYVYLEALNIDEEPYLFNGDKVLDAKTTPSSMYHTKFENTSYYSKKSDFTYNSAKCPVDYIDSGICIEQYEVINKKATFNVTYQKKIEVNNSELGITENAENLYCGEEKIVIVELEREKYYGKEHEQPVVEDYLFSGWFSDEACTVPFTETEGKAYAKFVDSDVLKVMAQAAVGIRDMEKGKLRFLSTVDSANYANVGFHIEFNGKTLTQELKNVYKKFYAVKSDGSKKYYEPTIASPISKYFIAYTLTGVPQAAHNVPFNVTPYWTTLDGTYVEGEETPKVISSMNGY